MLGNVQFPWRYLSVATPLLLYGIMEMLTMTQKHEGVGRVRTYSVILFCAATIPAALFFTDFTHQTTEYSYYDPASLGSDEVGAGEYMITGETFEGVSRTDVEAYDGVEVISYDKISGKAYLNCRNNTADDAIVTIPVASYSHYEAYDCDTGDTIEIPDDGAWRIQLLVPGGYSGTICVQFNAPWYWHAAEIVSIITLIVLGGIFIRTVYRKKN
jgi:hypothetical protein